MTVYVDNMRAQFGRMRMSHMIADSDEELRQMAQRIGVALKWHQYPGTSRSHFDICDSKAALAIKAGAVPISYRTLGCMTMRRRVTGELGDPASAETWVKGERLLCPDKTSV